MSASEITQAVCAAFKLATVEDAVTGRSFKIALYTADAALSEATEAYSAEDEVSGTGYPAGGFSLTPTDPALFGTTAAASFEDLTTGNLTVSGIRAGLIYDTSRSDLAVVALDFGRTISKSGEPLTITFPAPGAATGIIRIR